LLTVLGQHQRCNGVRKYSKSGLTGELNNSRGCIQQALPGMGILFP
jgi:hypothetical protein